jgi:hypothetical protein
MNHGGLLRFSMTDTQTSYSLFRLLQYSRSAFFSVVDNPPAGGIFKCSPIRIMWEAWLCPNLNGHIRILE